MIILLLVVFAILTFVTWMLIKEKKRRMIAGSLSFLLLSLTVAAMTLSFTHHLGMQQVSHTETQRIYTAGAKQSPAGVLLAQEIGTQSDNYVLIYRDRAQAAEPKVHFKPDQKHITQAIRKEADYRQAKVNHASVKTTTTRWAWKNDVYRLLFGIGGQGNELVKEKVEVTVPSDTWVVMSPQQAKQLAQTQAKMSPAMQAQQQAEIKQAVEAKMMHYQQVQPQASAAQLKAQTQYETAVLTAQAMKTTLAKIK